ncbi:MAG: ATP-binding protein [Cypionkella sp.]|nr:ATP-binding protein [Cypionkella sp.]
MKPALTPLPVVALCFAVTLAVAVWVVFTTLHQPWTGLELATDPDGPGARVIGVLPEGPAAALGLSPGDQVLAVAGVPLSAFDLVEEPDTLRSYDDSRRFYERQGRLALALRQPQTVLDVADAGGVRQVTLRPLASRPLSSLPWTFWSQLFAGASGLMIGIWVWSLRLRDPAAQLTALAGVALAVMIFPAAIYSSRDIALPADLFRVLAAVDHLGAMGFGLAMVVLFCLYPSRIVSPRKLIVLPVIVALWWLADTLRIVFPGPPTGFHLPAFLMLLVFIPAALVQYRRARHNPATRAALRWFTIAVAIGTGTFVTLVVLPNLLGFRQITSQANAFLLLLIVFAGIGLSVARYRLFELETWAFGLLFNLAAVLTIFAIDALLVFALAIGRVEALSYSLIAILLVYMTLRDQLRRWLSTPEVPIGTLFQRVVDVALTPPDQDQNQRWADLLGQAFDPLQLQKGAPVAAPMIIEDGLGLALPGVGGVTPMRLGHARGGRRLFTRADAALARDLCAMLAHALDSRHAREAGMAEERARISRDMHDNIGAKLLSALHCPGADRKDRLIRDALSDFRDIINDTAAADLSLDEMLADLRVECADRLEAAHITLDWRADEVGRAAVLAPAVHTLRSILREAVSNVIRHAEATRVEVQVRSVHGRIELRVKDNGRGVVAANAVLPGHGHGLANIRTRLEAVKGILRIDDSSGGGTELMAAFSLE